VEKTMENEKIDSLVQRAVVADLDGLDFLSSYDYATLKREYNGIGPEWAGAPIREKITHYLALFEPAALIHDMRNYMSDGSRYGFNFANVEFQTNCLKLADAAYPWYSWRRYRARAAAHIAYDFVSGPGGWKAWQDCYQRKLKG
jgi:hypothetical protein